MNRCLCSLAIALFLAAAGRGQTPAAPIVIKATPGITITSGGVTSGGAAIRLIPAGAAQDAPEDEDDNDGEVIPPFAPELVPVLDSFVQESRFDAASIDAFLDRCLLAQGMLEPLFAHVDALRAEGAPTEPATREKLGWLMAEARRRYGDLEIAETLYREQVALPTHAEDPAAWRALAEVLDARGKSQEALDAWVRLLELVKGRDEESRVRLRIALTLKTEKGLTFDATMSERLKALDIDREKDPVGAYARTRSVEEKNSAAIVLGLLGEPGAAADLLVVDGEGSKRLRQDLRLAGYLMDAERVDEAREAAWKAVFDATLDRDRRYALAVLVECYRQDDGLDRLVDRLAATPELPAAAQKLRVELLRELGRVDDAVALFHASNGGELTVEMRRELLDMYREADRDDELAAAYEDLIAKEPEELEWRQGYSRMLLERGRRDQALALWEAPFAGDKADRLMIAANRLRELGLDARATEYAEKAALQADGLAPARLFLFDLAMDRGRTEQAAQELESLDRDLPAESPARLLLGEAYERLGDKRSAVRVLARLRENRGEQDKAEDLDMRLAWLCSEIGDEERALGIWRELWTRVESLPRRAYVEDRLLNVSARLGNLADVAIELEEKIRAGTADDRERGLLVRLYTKANDPVSAAEILAEKTKLGGSELATLTEQARVYLACADFQNYEKAVRRMIELDPEGEPDYLRQLAMSALERARPDEARPWLRALKRLERGPEGAEFEAGVLSLAGLLDDAERAYRRGLAAHKERIEGSLLLADVLQRRNKKDRAIGMFQYLVETADKDDLFTVAIDGLLNMRADSRQLNWARRVTLARIGERSDKVFLYQLLADLSEEMSDASMRVKAMEAALASANERRGPVLRELMDLVANDGDRRLDFGRRLLSLGELVPPEVYLSLGEGFLAKDDVRLAARTYAKASDVPDFASFQRKVAGSFLTAGYQRNALRVYQNLLIGESTDVGLIAKIARLEEELGRDDAAADLGERAIELMLARRAFSSEAKEKTSDEDDPFSRLWGGNNLDAYDQYFTSVAQGYLASVGGRDLAVAGSRTQVRVLDMLDRLERTMETDRARAMARRSPDPEKRGLRNHPRLLSSADFYRRLAFAAGRLDLADRMDGVLLMTFPEDGELLNSLVEARLASGFIASARRLIDDCRRPEEQKAKARFLAGGAGEAPKSGMISAGAVSRLFLPLVLAGRTDEAKNVLRRVDLPALSQDDLRAMPEMAAAAVFLGDADSSLSFARRWLDAAMKFKDPWDVNEEARKAFGIVWPLLTHEMRRSLAQGLAGKLVEDSKKYASFIWVVADLQRGFPEPLLDAEEVKGMLEKGLTGDFYNATGLLQLMPASEHRKVLDGLWAKAPAFNGTFMLLDLLAGLKGKLQDDVAAFIREHFEASISSLKNPIYSYSLERSVCRNVANAELALELATILHAKDPKNLDYTAAWGRALMTAGKTEAAYAAGRQLGTMLLATTNFDYRFTQAVNALVQIFDNETSLLDEVFQKHEEEQGEVTKANLILHSEILKNANKIPEAIDLLRSGAERAPDDQDISRRLRQYYSAAGRRIEWLEYLEARAVEKKDASALRELETGWRSVGQLIRADEVKTKLAQGGKPSKDSAKQKPAAAPGADKAEPATIQRVRDKLEAGDAAEARRTWRGVWRGFANMRADDQPYYFWSWGPIRRIWPQARAAAEDEEGDEEGGGDEVGGLPDIDAPEKKVTAKSAYDVLAAEPFGADEMWRELHALEVSDLDRAGAIFAGLSLAIVAEVGEEAAVQRLLEPVRKGNAGKIDWVLLLDLLERNPGLLRFAGEGFLTDLAHTLNPNDAKQIRRLARLFAKSGDVPAAMRLYRWCLPLLSRARYSFFEEDVSTDEILDELIGILPESEREQAVEMVLSGAVPSPINRNDDAYKALTLDVRERVLGKKAAFERCRDLCLEVADLSKPGNVAAAPFALGLFIDAGDFERAMCCLERAICRPEPGEFQMGRMASPYMPLPRMKAAFPRPDSEGAPPLQWYLDAAESVTGWLRSGRVDLRPGSQLLCVIALRLHQGGADKQAADVEDFLAGRLAGDPSNLLWVIDAMRAGGREALALAAEKRLVVQKRMLPSRVPRVLARIAKAEGAPAALEIGEGAASWTASRELFDELIRQAKAAERPEAVESWTAMKARYEALDQPAKNRR